MSPGATSEILYFISCGEPRVIALKLFILNVTSESMRHNEFRRL